MKKVSKILYIIGIPINSCIAIYYLVRLLISNRLAAVTYSNLEYPLDSLVSFETFRALFLAFSIVMFALYLAAIALASITLAMQKRDKDNKVLHIVLIILGALSRIPLYIVGGVFGLIAVSKRNSNPNP